MRDLKEVVLGMQRELNTLNQQIEQIDKHTTKSVRHLEQLLAQSGPWRQTFPVPRNQLESTTAIQLRSGTSYREPPMPLEYEVEDITNTQEDIAPVVQPRIPTGASNRSVLPKTDRYPDDDARPISSSVIDNPAVIEKPTVSTSKKQVEAAVKPVQLPYPGRMRNQKIDQQFGKFVEVIKTLQVSVPFTELITQVPSYAKFMKDILSKKRSIENISTIAFTEQYSAILQNKTPPKLKDPGCFSIPCTIGKETIEKALCDLGASVSVMPYTICQKLKLGNLKFTNMTLQMADRSIKRPVGLLEDVPVQIGKYFIPVDFVVLDIAEDANIPIILGRPFLNTAGAIIDVKQGRLTLEVGEDKVTFYLQDAMKSPMI